MRLTIVPELFLPELLQGLNELIGGEQRNVWHGEHSLNGSGNHSPLLGTVSAPPLSSSILLWALRPDYMDCYQWAMAGFGQGEASTEYGGEVGALVPNPSSLPARPWMGSDCFPLPAKGLFPVPKDRDIPCPEPHTFANDPFIVLSLISPCECVSDSCKDHSQHGNHHHHHPHPAGKPLALFL